MLKKYPLERCECLDKEVKEILEMALGRGKGLTAHLITKASEAKHIWNM